MARRNVFVEGLVSTLLQCMAVCLTVIITPPLLVFWVTQKVRLFMSFKSRPKRLESKGAYLENLYRHGFLELNDINIHYVEAGSRQNPLMLCLHGFPEFWYSWRHQLSEFSSTHWVVAVDLRGYGKSDAPLDKDNYELDTLMEDVRQILEKLGRERCILLGHDWGGAIGWNLVTHYPNLVEKFVVLNCPHPAAFMQVAAKTPKQWLRSWYMLFYQLPAIPELYLSLCDLALFRFLFHRHAPDSAITKTDTDFYLQLYSGNRSALTGPINYYRNLVSTGPPITHKITVPTLIIWGTGDVYLDVTMAPTSLQYLRRGKIRLVPGASHWVQQDRPAAVNEDIRNFVVNDCGVPTKEL